MENRRETIQFRIPADPKHIAMVRRAIKSVACSLDFPESVADDIELSVAEALANAVKHGSSGSDNVVTAICRVTEDQLVIDVLDHGPGFERESTNTNGLWAENGRGLRLIYHLMDKVRISKTCKGAKIRMTKAKQPTTSVAQPSLQL